MPKVIIICMSPPPSASSFQDIVYSDKADRGCFINTGQVSIFSESPSKQDSTTLNGVNTGRKFFSGLKGTGSGPETIVLPRDRLQTRLMSPKEQNTQKQGAHTGKSTHGETHHIADLTIVAA